MTADVDVDWHELSKERIFLFNPSRDDEIDCKWRVLRTPEIPEPTIEHIEYTPPSRIVDKYRDSGLQVIIKMASIELTPEKPNFPAGGWHVSPPLKIAMGEQDIY